MPDLVVKTEQLESPTLKPSHTSITDHSDPETDTFEDASDISLTESSTGRPSSPDPSLTEHQLSPKNVKAKIIKDASRLSVSLEKRSNEHGKPNSNHLSPVKSSESSESPVSPVSPLGSGQKSNWTNAALLEKNPPDEDNPDQTLPFSNSKLESSKLALDTKIMNSSKSPPSQEPETSAQVAESDQVQPIVSARKLTSPFSWLSRNITKDSSTATSQITNSQQRRDTASSIATNESNPETTNNNSENSRRPSRGSLRDRFKILRMREEYGITSTHGTVYENNEEIGGDNRNKSIDKNQFYSDLEGKEVPISTPITRSNSSLSSPDTATAASIDNNSAVDWDLWQSVVDEGPAAVSRSSPEELNRAIATGIPNVIRGVVWQILAQSKNEELEKVYRDLVARGTEKDQNRMSKSSDFGSFSQSASSINGKEEVNTSSASSIRSDYSTAANSILNGLRSPISRESEQANKFKSTSPVEKKKSYYEDAALLKKLEKTIRRDLGSRTSFSKFASSTSLQEGLFGVCKAYALFDEGVGYAQGMNFIAMPLLFNMPEDEAFCLFVKLMNQYHLRDLFVKDMPGLHMHLYQFERLLEDLEPALYCHLQRCQVTPHLYATQWFLTLFAYRFPLQLVLRIYDLILSEGLVAIIKFGIVLMQKNSTTLLGMSEMSKLTTFLKDRLFDVYIDVAPSSGSILESGFFGRSGSSIDKEVYRADQLVQDACAVKMTPELLKSYTLEWEEKNRLEKERESQIENLRIGNKKLTHKVRRLEERVQDHDKEHAALATELVMTKLKNEELTDENESLKVQVKELKDMIERLPQETEERLKLEMDRLLKRNQEVHDQNNRLEDEIAQTEKTLVETKMKYAEINAAHETLTRKWNDLRKALGD